MERTDGAVFVLVCGPPGSGKTELASELAVRLENSLLVSFDNVYSADDQNNAVEAGAGQLRLLRRTILLGVEEILDGNPTGSAAEVLLRAGNACCWRRPVDHFIRCDNFIIDDNMYLRSMRYCWFQMARKRGCSMCTVYLKTSLAECLRRNQMRAMRVDESIVRQQHLKMEPPSCAVGSWEQYSCHSDGTDIQNILRLINTARKNPYSLEASLAIKDRANRSKEENICSLAHRLDLAYRKAISRIIEKNGTSGIDKQQFWMSARLIKKNIIAEARMEVTSSESFQDISTARHTLDEFLVDLLSELLLENLIKK